MPACQPAWLQRLPACLPGSLPAAYNDEVRTTLLDKRLQQVLLRVDGADNREQVRGGSKGALRAAEAGVVGTLERGKG